VGSGGGEFSLSDQIFNSAIDVLTGAWTQAAVRQAKGKDGLWWKRERRPGLSLPVMRPLLGS